VTHEKATDVDALPGRVRWRFVGVGADPAAAAWNVVAGFAGLTCRIA
jgi:hypothetical protein